LGYAARIIGLLRGKTERWSSNDKTSPDLGFPQVSVLLALTTWSSINRRGSFETSEVVAQRPSRGVMPGRYIVIDSGLGDESSRTVEPKFVIC
jgi:hypothetical protein